MYEQHFGLSAPPFQLNPDNGFYYGSKGHSHALAYLRYGAYQAEGFIVVTGEIGAGKTTLVRTLLAELDSTKVVAGQVVSTQLEAEDLLRTILTAFGVSASAPSKAALIATLESFLTLVASRGQRALLIIDEAQNLGNKAVEELRMLSNFQLGNHALLQSFLIGQPDLRRLLQEKSMEQLRQRVIASAHLGPLDAAETQAYIEHRLRHVGWNGRPAFGAGVFEIIHRWTGGIPRRINVLCNRLLLGAYLTGNEEIDADFVQRVADEVRLEVGEPTPAMPPMSLVAAGGTHTQPALRAGGTKPVRMQREAQVAMVRPILCVASAAHEFRRARSLAGRLEHTAGVQFVVATPHGAEDAGRDEPSTQAIEAAALEIHLGATRAVGSATATIMALIDDLLAEVSPFAVVVFGSSDAALAGCLAAYKRGLRIFAVDGPSPASNASATANGALIASMASVTHGTAQPLDASLASAQDGGDPDAVIAARVRLWLQEPIAV